MTTSSPTGPVPQDSPLALDATHRCDRCAAQAYVRVALLAGGELLFCGHHYHRHADSLAGRTVWIFDARERLAAAPAAASALG